MTTNNDENRKLAERAKRERENDLYNDIQTAIVAVMAVILEAGDRAEGGLTEEAAKYVKRARAIYTEAMKQMRTDGI